MSKLKALIVDDSAFFRKILGDMLAEHKDVEVVGTAFNGKNALEKVKTLAPDFVTLDFVMPDMDGIATLRQLKKVAPQVDVVMISAQTTEGAAITVKALEEGACDFVAKPVGLAPGDEMKTMSRQLKEIIDAITCRRRISRTADSLRRMAGGGEAVSRSAAPAQAPAAAAVRAKPFVPSSGDGVRRDIVALGISTGGPIALRSVIPKLPASLSVPVVVVQHMPPLFTAALAGSLAQKSAVRVVEGIDGVAIESGVVYIAPGGRQMKLEKRAGSVRIKSTDDPPENNCRRAADYLFRSVAEIYRAAAVGVIMTGMGSDGAMGLREMKSFGARVIAQDEETSTVFGMPMMAIKAGVVDVVAPLEAIAAEIVKSVGG